MLVWLSENIGTIVISLVLLAIICAIIAKLISDRKKGRSTCGNNCAHCSMSGSCHKKK